MKSSFIVRTSDLDQRLDPGYYNPDLLQLEQQVNQISSGVVGDYAVSIAAGSTPKDEDTADEVNSHYTDADNGVPFIRVNNLSPSGELDLGEVKYVTLDTHNTLLKRSRVHEGDLLVKITGVGRMAVASLAPQTGEANVNQHVVCIKTKSPEISRLLVAWLNTDVAEALASRRSTGGTRPALDFPALLSMPVVISDDLLKETQNAYLAYREELQREAELRAGVNERLIADVGLKVPPVYEPTGPRRFRVSASSVVGRRIDPHPLHPDLDRCVAEVQKARTVPLGEAVTFHRVGAKPGGQDLSYVGLEDIERDTGRLIDVGASPEDPPKSGNLFQAGDVLFSRLRPYLNKVHLAAFEGYCSSEIFVLRPRRFSGEYISMWLRSPLVLRQLIHLSTGNTLPRLQLEDLAAIMVPEIAPEAEQELVRHAREGLSSAEQILKAARTTLDRTLQQLGSNLLADVSDSVSVGPPTPVSAGQ